MLITNRCTSLMRRLCPRNSRQAFGVETSRAGSLSVTTALSPIRRQAIDVKTREVVAQLTDEEDRAVGSEKLLEIDWDGDTPVQSGNQFGVGRVTER